MTEGRVSNLVVGRVAAALFILSGLATVTTPLPLLPEAPPVPPGGTGVNERPHAEEAS